MPQFQIVRLVASWKPGLKCKLMAIDAVKSLPDLEHLSISGRLGRFGDVDSGLEVSFHPSKVATAILIRGQTQLPILRNLKKLKSLKLPDAVSVGVGTFDGGPWCGNAYDNADGTPNEEYILEIRNKWLEAERNVATIVGKAFGPELQELKVGSVSFRFKRNVDGEFVDIVRK